MGKKINCMDVIIIEFRNICLFTYVSLSLHIYSLDRLKTKFVPALDFT